MKFLTKYDEPKQIKSEAGSPLAPEYQMQVMEDGSKELVQVGYTDLQKEIQSHAMSVDINLIMSRVKNGETDLLEQAKGYYMDVSEMPGDLATALNLANQGEALFEKLPIEVKSKFNGYVDMVNRIDDLMDALQPFQKQKPAQDQKPTQEQKSAQDQKPTQEQKQYQEQKEDGE